MGNSPDVKDSVRRHHAPAQQTTVVALGTSSNFRFEDSTMAERSNSTSNRPIKVGLIADQTGPLSPIGEANANVARMVVGVSPRLNRSSAIAPPESGFIHTSLFPSFDTRRP